MPNNIDLFQKIKSVGKLADSIAHDLNNILAGISGYVDLLLLEENLSDDVRYMISGIKSLTKNSKDLIDNFRSLNPTRTVESSSIDLNSTISNQSKVLKELLPDSIQLHIEIDPNPTLVKFNETELKQILINLVTNSVNAISGSGQISIKSTMIENDNFQNPNLVKSSTNRYAILTITDDGVGIPKSEMDQVFDPFFTTNKKGKHVGLGLSIVYSIVTRAGGFIDLNSQEDQGTAFRIVVPVQENELINEINNKIDDATSEISSGLVEQKKAILVVDDNQSILKILSQTLLMRKFNVIATSKPLEALQILQDNADSIDLVISDIVMPELSGIDLVERFMESKPDVKVIFITGYVQVPSVQKKVEKLNFPILTKPFDLEVFVDLVIKTLNE